MRKLILISAFAFASIAASVSAQADDSRNLILAANDTPAATTTATPAATTAPTEAATTDTTTSKKQASKSQKKPQARRETDEQKAHRIAAKYGVYW